MCCARLSLSNCSSAVLGSMYEDLNQRVSCMQVLKIKTMDPFVLTVDYPMSMCRACSIHTSARKILLFYPSPTSRKCILSMLVNIPQNGLLDYDAKLITERYFHVQKTKLQYLWYF